MKPHISAPYFGVGDTRAHQDLKDFDKPTLILIDSIDVDLLNSDEFFYKFYINCEPGAMGAFDTVIANKDKFNLIFSWDKRYESCDNYHFLPFGTSWITGGSNIDRSDEFLIDDKIMKISYLCGAKQGSVGYDLRHRIFKDQDKISMPKEMHMTLPRDGVGMGKDPLFKDSMFYICIENSRIPDYFTEKIMDCFMTKTIPIYWGCPNIGDYFNTDGIITFESDEDLFGIINSLDENSFKSRESSIMENYEKALPYRDLFYRVNKTLTEKGY